MTGVITWVGFLLAGSQSTSPRTPPQSRTRHLTSRAVGVKLLVGREPERHREGSTIMNSTPRRGRDGDREKLRCSKHCRWQSLSGPFASPPTGSPGSPSPAGTEFHIPRSRASAPHQTSDSRSRGATARHGDASHLTPGSPQNTHNGQGHNRPRSGFPRLSRGTRTTVSPSGITRVQLDEPRREEVPFTRSSEKKLNAKIVSGPPIPSR